MVEFPHQNMVDGNPRCYSRNGYLGELALSYVTILLYSTTGGLFAFALPTAYKGVP
jgi:hypothetical protein